MKVRFSLWLYLSLRRTVMHLKKTSIKNKKLMDSSTKNIERKGHEEKLTKK
ncbi:hypothetical protein KsCSTR_11020 [Candidatus Kuenenia stuttgartiensis]|uniref:Uncharacterized protein n=1 Tax=Kuenenia stuttgartiensis TaxID=174633 RepID=A0A6G7GM22_KUEST|nr:hypothetical protein KsCSTR_11020 [Candidatus Kuenenia stuttgartiensis]